jgi:hypothetical protein
MRQLFLILICALGVMVFGVRHQEHRDVLQLTLAVDWLKERSYALAFFHALPRESIDEDILHDTLHEFEEISTLIEVIKARHACRHRLLLARSSLSPRFSQLTDDANTHGDGVMTIVRELLKTKYQGADKTSI